MDAPFTKLGLAITFSPTGKALLKESLRFKQLFNASFSLIHVGKKHRKPSTFLKKRKVLPG